MRFILRFLQQPFAVVGILGSMSAGFLLTLVVLPPGGASDLQAAPPRAEPRPAQPQGRDSAPNAAAVQVLTLNPGMSASAMERTVTNRVERWVNQADGVRRISSHTVAGVSIVRVEFRPDIHPAVALAQVSALAQATVPTLPPSTAPPLILPLLPSHTRPLAWLTISHPALDEAALKDVARRDVRQPLNALEGCAAPVVFGGRDRTLTLFLDPKRMEAYKVAPRDVAEALRKANRPIVTGTAYVGDHQVLLATDVPLGTIDAFHDLPIRIVSGQVVFLRDVGRVEATLGIPTSRVRLNGHRGVAIPVYARVGADVAALRERLAQALPRIERRLPAMTRLEFLSFDAGRKDGPPEDRGFITLSIRGPAGLRLDVSEKRVAAVEHFLETQIPAGDRLAIVAELGLTADVSAAYSQNAGQQDCTMHVVLSGNRRLSTGDYVRELRRLFQQEANFSDLRVRFAAADHEPSLAIQIEGGTADAGKKSAHDVQQRVAAIAGTANVTVMQRVDAPALAIAVDRSRAAAVGLSAQDVMEQAAAALTSRLPGDRRIWIDSATGAEYLLTVEYADSRDRKLEDMLNMAITGTNQPQPIKLSNLATLRQKADAVEIDHVNLRRVFTVQVNVESRPRREVIADINKALKEMRVPEGIRLDLDGQEAR